MKIMHICLCSFLFFIVLSLPTWGQPTDAESSSKSIVDETESSVSPEEPKPEMERPTIWGEPTEVKILIYIIDVDEVNTAEQNFTASVFIESRWNIPALQHEGSGPLIKSTTDIWTPRLVLINQQQGWRAFPDMVEISPDGEVTYRQKTWGKFSQPFDLRDFPLDHQKLTIHYATAGLLETEVKMVPLIREAGRRSGIAERFSLPDFEVLSWKAGPMPYYPAKGEAGTAGFQMEIEVGRHLTYYIAKIIVPLCLIVMMSWVPLWTDPRQIGSNLAVSATSFLTLVAYYFAMAVVLPRTSYLTRMDIFISLSTIMVFACLMQTVVMTNMVRRKKDKFLGQILKWSRAIYPITLLLVIAYSFLL